MSENIYKQYKPPASDGGMYHKFEDGVTYVMRIASEPIVYNTEFQSPNGETTISTKYAWVVWNVENKVAQIMQLPVTGYRQIASFAADDEYGDPTQYSLKITRTGKAVETKYAVVPSPSKTPLEALDPEAPDAVKKIDLIDAVSAGKGVSNVFWLKDALNPAEQQKAVTQKQVNDVLMEEPIDLSAIPF